MFDADEAGAATVVFEATGAWLATVLVVTALATTLFDANEAGAATVVFEATGAWLATTLFDVVATCAATLFALMVLFFTVKRASIHISLPTL